MMVANPWAYQKMVFRHVTFEPPSPKIILGKCGGNFQDIRVLHGSGCNRSYMARFIPWLQQFIAIQPSSNHLNTIPNRRYTSSFISCVFSLSAVCSIQFGSTKKKHIRLFGWRFCSTLPNQRLGTPAVFSVRGLIAQRWWQQRKFVFYWIV